MSTTVFWIMRNFTNLHENNSQITAQSNAKTEIWIIVWTPMLISFFCFLYLITIMLSEYFTTPHVKENGRYVLFAHMLINDLIYVTIAAVLFFLAIIQVYIPVTICYFLVTVSSTSFKVTPYNLAVMSLERYVAICFPLRHSEFCTRRRIGHTVALVWTAGLIPNVIDFIILASSVQVNFFSRYVICGRVSFLNTAIQSILRTFTHAFSFSLMALIIVFTYIKIMLVAKKIDSGKASASKASKTIILHAIQLLLCMMAFTYPITETYLKGYIIMLPTVNFCFFMCLPRFLSPLIYGIRDDAFRACIARYVFCKTVRVDQFTHR